MPSIEGDVVNPTCCTLGNAMYVYYCGVEHMDIGISMLKSPGATSVASMGSWEVLDGESGM